MWRLIGTFVVYVRRHLCLLVAFLHYSQKFRVGIAEDVNNIQTYSLVTSGFSTITTQVNYCIFPSAAVLAKHRFAGLRSFFGRIYILMSNAQHYVRCHPFVKPVSFFFLFMISRSQTGTRWVSWCGRLVHWSSWYWFVGKVLTSVEVNDVIDKLWHLLVSFLF